MIHGNGFDTAEAMAEAERKRDALLRRATVQRQLHGSISANLKVELRYAQIIFREAVEAHRAAVRSAEALAYTD